MKLFLREIRDRYIQENFKKIKAELEGLDSGSSSVITRIIKILETVETGSSAKLSFTKTAAEAISAFTMVILTSAGTVEIAEIDSYTEANTVGMAITSAAAGSQVTVVMLGIIEDASFSYTANEPIFLDSVGAISATAPTAVGEFIVQVGQSLGAGAIFVDPQPPVEIVS